MPGTKALVNIFTLYVFEFCLTPFNFSSKLISNRESAFFKLNHFQEIRRIQVPGRVVGGEELERAGGVTHERGEQYAEGGGIVSHLL